MSTKEKRFDVVIDGATGFTGGLVAAYFARGVPPSETSWAIAGRNPAKLEQVRASLVSIHPRCAEVGVLPADHGDEASLLAMAQQARVVLTTVGPYAEHGEPLVRACIEGGADYVDITGEPAFVASMVERYHAEAERRGVLIVNCCGFDSIPADLGTLFTVSKLPAGARKRVECFVSTKGRPSGGTWASLLTGLASYGPRDRPLKGASSFRPGLHYEKEVRGWGVPLPLIDPSIVRRSSQALPQIYGPGFEYGHYLRLRSLPKVAGIAVGAAGLFAISRIAPARDLLKRLFPQGEGPSEEIREKSFFRLTFIGTSEGLRVVTTVGGGDPGYTETSKMVAESALMLAQRRDALERPGGVVTPAIAFGERLIPRLQAAGITFEVAAPAQ